MSAAADSAAAAMSNVILRFIFELLVFVWMSRGFARCTGAYWTSKPAPKPPATPAAR
jgi:hypothetical protein